MDVGLHGKWVFVAGSSKGIGYGIARRFLEEGANVILTGRDCNTLESAYNNFTETYNENRVLNYCGDLLDELFVHDIANELEAQLVEVSHIVCNVGSGKASSVMGNDVSEFKKMLDVNFLTSVNVTLGIGRLMFNDDGALSHHRTITYISTICSKSAIGCPVAYVTAKAALDAYAKNMSKHLAKYGVRVNLVSPGNILFSGSTWEDKMQANEAAVKKMLSDKVPLNKLGNIDDVASLVVFLSSEHAGFITGSDFIVDGGQLNIA